MPHISIRTFHRDDLIKLGQVVAAWVKENQIELPHVITFDGDSSSGKSLVALGADSFFRPGLYPLGIGDPEKHSADAMLKPSLWDYSVPPVVFKNYGNLIKPHDEDFDDELRQRQQEYQGAKVFFVSQLQRTFFGDFDYASRNLCSNVLSANFNFRCKTPCDESFKRTIRITARDQSLIDKIAQAGFSISSVPRPPA